MSRKPLNHTSRAVLLLWIVFLLRGFWYCAVLPLWEGYDEPFHFAYLQHIAAGQGLPGPGTPVSLQVQNSLHLAPVPWELQFQSIPAPLLTYDYYWRLSPEERARRETALARLRPEQGAQPATEPIGNYETQQAPLYYRIIGLPLRRLGYQSLVSQVFLLRMLNVLLASTAVPLTFLLARRVFRDTAGSLAVTAFVVCLPEMMINIARVSNEALALPLFTLLMLSSAAVVDDPARWRWWMLLGTTLGCGLMTKAYFLTALPAIGVVVVMALKISPELATRKTLLQFAARVVVAVSLAAMISGGWYARVHAATGSWSGQGDDAALRGVSFGQKLAALPHVNWKSGAASVLISHIWFGGWSFLRLPVAVYVLALLTIAAAVAGAIVRWARRSSSDRETRRILAVLAAFYLCVWAGLAYHVLVTYLHQGVSASTGWYLYSLVAAESILLLWGLEAFLPARIVFPSLCGAAAVLDLYGMHAQLLPYYTGLSAHVNGRVPAALRLCLSNISVVFARLGVNKPEWLTPPVVVLMWIGYLAATIGAVYLSFRSFVWEARSEQ